MTSNTLRNVTVTRYIEPLKEGGSLPGLVEADDNFKYVLKFKGAGQGYKALVAELIGGLLAKALDLKIPELVFAHLDESFGRTEPDQEIQDLLRASEGCNLALHFLSGAITFDPVVNRPAADLATKIVWLDALIFNVDRTARNTNMLMWKHELWLIDHGAALYFHHSWDNWEDYINRPFAQIKDHVLLPFIQDIDSIDHLFKKRLTPEVIAEIVHQIPDNWLENDGDHKTASEKKAVYTTLLTQRVQQSVHFLNAIKNAG